MEVHFGEDGGEETVLKDANGEEVDKMGGRWIPKFRQYVTSLLPILQAIFLIEFYML